MTKTPRAKPAGNAGILPAPGRSRESRRNRASLTLLTLLTALTVGGTSKGPEGCRLRRVKHFSDRLRAKASSSWLRLRSPRYLCKPLAKPPHNRCLAELTKVAGASCSRRRPEWAHGMDHGYRVFPGHAGRAGRSPHFPGHPSQPTPCAVPVNGCSESYDGRFRTSVSLTGHRPRQPILVPFRNHLHHNIKAKRKSLTI